MNPSDVLLLASKGLLIAAVPLLFVYTRRGQDRVRRLAWLAVFLTFDLAVFGGFTRLTDSGLGCPDWPGCFAKSTPWAAAGDIAAAHELAPFGPVSMAKAWIEMVHRFLAMGVGVVLVVLLVLVWRQRRVPGRSPELAAACVGMVLLQGAFGALTVTQKLQPAIVTTHLLLALTLLGLLTVQALEVSRASAPAPAAPGRMLSGVAALGMGLVVVQIALGGWVSTNYAVLACTDFPTCHGQWVPQMDLREGFEIWRPLGRTADNGFLSFQALTAIHWVHRSFAAVVALVLATLAALAWRVPGYGRLARALALLLVAQLATGMGNILLTYPLAIAVLHNAGAAALVVIMVMLNYRTFRRPSGALSSPRSTADLALT